MTFSIKRKSVEGAMSMGLIPNSAHSTIKKILDSVPDIEVIDVAIRAYTKESKEVDIGAGIKLKLMSILLGAKGDNA